jgi:hypothetical protein
VSELELDGGVAWLSVRHSEMPSRSRALANARFWLRRAANRALDIGRGARGKPVRRMIGAASPATTPISRSVKPSTTTSTSTSEFLQHAARSASEGPLAEPEPAASTRRLPAPRNADGKLCFLRGRVELEANGRHRGAHCKTPCVGFPPRPVQCHVYCEINERNELIKRRHRLGRTTRTRAEALSR